MLYRVMIGFVPMILIALVATGAIPLGGLLPTSEYRSSAVRGEEGEGAAKNGSPRTPEGKLSQKLGLISSEDIAMMEDNMEAVAEMERESEKFQEMQRRGVAPNWQASPGGGWGR